VGLANVNITSVNIAPVAVNDAVAGVANFPVAINVLANDTDINGTADIVAAVNVTQPSPAGASTSVAGGIVTFAATAPGTYSFTYRAQDAGGLVSVTPATVTVQVAAVESITVDLAEYIQNKSRLRVSGVISPNANQTVTLEFVNGNTVPPTVLGTAGTVASAAGAWALDTVIPLPDGTTSVKASGAYGGVNAIGLTLR
jgi:hypothetical protein